MTKKRANRLINEKSPYLLQHAYNPVNWYPWGKEAIELAKDLDRPIFLSIGYATCHWCHVMEKESFEDESIASLLNDTFICIKVDREELPEIDNLYMEFAQTMMTGAAGWPLNVILTPQLLPFYAATYLPPRSRHGMMGLEDLIHKIQNLWESEEKEVVIMQAEKILEIFQENLHTKGDKIAPRSLFKEAAEYLFKLADPIWGGMKGSPKFPIGYQIPFMLRFAAAYQDSRALFFVEKTLEMMHRGGIYDHLGGGFSRYSVDEKWFTPHFEKMLYDNAILVMSYLEAWQATKKPLYRKVAEEILEYLMRDMAYSEGGFFSAEDADSEGVEGLFYIWTKKEIAEVLSKQDLELFCFYFGVRHEGNFGERNILYMPLSHQEVAQKKQMDERALEEFIVANKELLLKKRQTRIRPFRDNKILVSWNGLAIRAFAEAAFCFSEHIYKDVAKKTAFFILKNLEKKNGLLHRWCDGEAQFPALLDDYAFLISGFISLFETTGEPLWLEKSLEYTNYLEEHFKENDGAFFQSDGNDETLILRKCQYADGAEPSGNAVHCENLLRLYQMSGEIHFLEQAQDILKSVNMFLENYPPGYCYHIMNLDRYYDNKASLFVLALGENEREDKRLLQEILGATFIPHKSIVWKAYDSQEIDRLLPNLKPYRPRDGQTTLYICRSGICLEPISVIDEIVEKIKNW